MSTISGAYDVIVTFYENREKFEMNGKTASNMSK